MLVRTGAIVKHKNNTIPIIGKTAPNDSFSFSSNFVRYNFKCFRAFLPSLAESKFTSFLSVFSLLFYHEIHSQKRKFSINFSRAKPCNFFSFPVILNEDTTGGQRL